MPYLGNTAADRFVAAKAATQFSGDGSTTAFTLEHAVGSDEDILVSVDGVIQEPSVAYAVSNGTTLTFTGAPSSNAGNNIFVYYLFRTVGTIGHPSNGALSASTGTFTGNVGVGVTTAPDANLQVGGALNSAGTYRGALALKTQTVGSITPGEAALYIEETSGGEGYYVGVDSNGGMFFNNSGTSTTLQLGDDGTVIKSSQPCFSAGASTTNIPLATTTKVTLSSERFDVGSNVSSDTFTAPVTGKYLFTYIFYFSSLDADHTTLDATIKTSNTQYQQTVKPSAFLNADANFSLTGSMLCDMDANDTFFMNVYVQAGAAQTDIHTDSHVSGVLIC